MKIALIAIGNELLNGKINDLNAHFLAKECLQSNHELIELRIIPDCSDELKRAIDELSQKSDLIITSGGLGPTPDDLTKDILCEYFGLEKVEREDAILFMQKQMRKHERDFDKSKSDYANIPKEFEIIDNSVGVAPGLKYKNVLALPGVPLEFQEMIKSNVTTLKGESKNSHLIVKTYYLPESKIFNEFGPNLWDDLSKLGSVSSLPHPLGVDIGVNLNDESLREQALEIIKSTEIKDYIWHVGSETIEEVIINEANKRNIKFGFSESCTGGLNASRITDVSGSSSVFWGSIVSYSNEVKMSLLDVSSSTLDKHGAVSEQTALEMAIGAKKNMGIDIAISTTGIAGPGGATEEKPVGTVGIGISSKHGDSSKIYKFVGDRLMLKQRFSQMALFLLLDEIRKF